MREIRKRHSDIPQDGLFEMAESDQQSAEPTKRTAKPKTVGTKACPQCMNGKVGIIKVWNDTHYIYVLRDHDRVLRKGHRFRCPGSGLEVDEPAK